MFLNENPSQVSVSTTILPYYYVPNMAEKGRMDKLVGEGTGSRSRSSRRISLVMTTADGVMGFQGIAINVWLIWMLPFIGAALIPALRRNKSNLLNYTAVGFSLASAILAATLIPLALTDSEVHSQINWISALNLDAGILADPLAIIMTNVVAWISFLIFVYSVGYLHGERDLTRYWFFMLFFIGSMELNRSLR